MIIWGGHVGGNTGGIYTPFRTYTVGGTISNLVTGTSVVLSNNGTDILTIGADGAFTFATTLKDASEYNVIVNTQPTHPEQECSVTNGAGTIEGENVDTVQIICKGTFPWHLFLLKLK